MLLRILFLGALLIVTGRLDAGERLSIRVSPEVAMAPANLVVHTRIEADQANRAIEIVAESENFYRASEMPLNGDRAPRVSTFEFNNLPGGAYRVRATLRGAGGGQLAVARANVQILEGAAPDR